MNIFKFLDIWLGDPNRSPENMYLMTFHMLFAREHNRIAKKLFKRNPNLSDEKLYQEARRINIAQQQYIIYKEYLPSVLGEEFAKEIGVYPIDEGYNSIKPEDRTDIDGRPTNEFVTAGFRFGHSMVVDKFE